MAQPGPRAIALRARTPIATHGWARGARRCNNEFELRPRTTLSSRRREHPRARECPTSGTPDARRSPRERWTSHHLVQPRVDAVGTHTPCASADELVRPHPVVPGSQSAETKLCPAPMHVVNTPRAWYTDSPQRLFAASGHGRSHPSSDDRGAAAGQDQRAEAYELWDVCGGSKHPNPSGSASRVVATSPSMDRSCRDHEQERAETSVRTERLANSERHDPQSQATDPQRGAVIRRSTERQRLHSGGQNLWLTFYPSQPSDPLANGFSSLVTLNEGFLEPEGHMLTYSRRGSRTITYVIDGTMAQRNESRRPVVIGAGEFQCSSAAFSDCAIHANASRCEPLHVLQLSLFSNQPRQPVELQKKHFPPPDREGRLCLVASADGSDGSLSLGQDVRLYSGVLKAAQRSAYSLRDGRAAWLHVLRGAVNVDHLQLAAGDGAGFVSPAELSLLASSDAEFVLLDLTAHVPLVSGLPGEDRGTRQTPSGRQAAAASSGPAHTIARA